MSDNDYGTCQSEFEEFANCFTGWLGQPSQASCQACVDVVTNDLYNLTDTSSQLFLSPATKCVRANSAACLYLGESACLWDDNACESCAYYVQAYLLCMLEDQYAMQGIGCAFPCDGAPVAAAPARPAAHPAAGWIAGVAVALWFFSRRGA